MIVWPFFFCKKEKKTMKERDQDNNERQQPDQCIKSRANKYRSGAFKEVSRGDEKSTTNIEEEAHLEQERKEAMTERD